MQLADHKIMKDVHKIVAIQIRKMMIEQVEQESLQTLKKVMDLL